MQCLDHRSFLTWKQTFSGPNSTSPLPPCNVVRKERRAEESSNIAQGGWEGGRILREFGKKGEVSHTFRPGFQINKDAKKSLGQGDWFQHPGTVASRHTCECLQLDLLLAEKMLHLTFALWKTQRKRLRLTGTRSGSVAAVRNCLFTDRNTLMSISSIVFIVRVIVIV